ncbi:hypothetical protein [Rhizocola hellebori]|uniref:hypothetical protein n=1 Tax=Rhizocola hellebori TaxID=1392758 RepID=UPI001943B8D2|nr:hypothetical protein [Rhizocola hellebori]
MLIVSACSQAKPGPVPQPTPARPEQCATAVDTVPEPPRTLEVVLGVVALPTQKVLQANDVGQPGELFAKQGLVVKADAEVELAVGDGVVGARLEWNGVATTGPVTHHVPCVGQTGWRAYAGGFYVAEPSCLPIMVRAGSGEQTVRIAVGVAC